MSQYQGVTALVDEPNWLESRLFLTNVMMWTAPAPASGSIESCAKMVVVEQPFEGAPSMGKSITDLSSVTTVGLDLAKHVFQVHGVDAFGRVIVAKALRRKDVLGFFAQLPRCLVGLEACGSAHHWARELIKLGHDARMMPPAYVKPYVRRQKNDAADAAGICEAVTRPSMRFVGVRTLENQVALMHHKAREMLVAQRTQLINALRGHLAEIGVIAAQGLKKTPANWRKSSWRKTTRRFRPAFARRLPRSCVNCMPWTRRLRAATKSSPR